MTSSDVDNAGLKAEDVAVYDVYREPDATQQSKRTSYFTLIYKAVKLVLLTVLILVVIAVGAIVLASVATGQGDHEHGQLAILEEKILAQGALMSELRDDLARSEQKVSQQETTINGMKEDLTSLRDQIENPAEEIDAAQAEAECLAAHEHAAYANETCYFRLPRPGTTGLTWLEAETTCGWWAGARLATPRTEHQWRAVYNLSRPEWGAGYSWLGFIQAPPNGPWRDSSGDDVTADVRAKLLSEHTGSDCAFAFYNREWPKFVDDYSCVTTNVANFICQYWLPSPDRD